jgi:hypothetical protein
LAQSARDLLGGITVLDPAIRSVFTAGRLSASRLMHGWSRAITRRCFVQNRV